MLDGLVLLPKVWFLHNSTCTLPSRRTTEGLAKDSNGIVVVLQNERLKRMSHGRFQMFNDFLPVFPQIVIDIIVVRLPYKHVHPLSCLRKAELLRVDLDNFRAERTWSLEHERIVRSGDTVCLNELGQGARLSLHFHRIHVSLARTKESLDHRTSTNSVYSRNTIDDNLVVFI